MLSPRLCHWCAYIHTSTHQRNLRDFHPVPSSKSAAPAARPLQYSPQFDTTSDHLSSWLRRISSTIARGHHQSNTYLRHGHDDSIAFFPPNRHQSKDSSVSFPYRRTGWKDSEPKNAKHETNLLTTRYQRGVKEHVKRNCKVLNGYTLLFSRQIDNLHHPRTTRAKRGAPHVQDLILSTLPFFTLLLLTLHNIRLAIG